MKAVLLRHMRRDGKDTKPHVHLDEKPSLEENAIHKQDPVLEELIEEIEIDTTPSRNHVTQVLGGPFTFLGQWPSAGTVAIIRKDFLSDLPSDLKQLPIRDLRNHCKELEIDTSLIIEKAELVAALEEKRNDALPLNPHRLQPPLHNLDARGDILVLKVAETREELDDEDEECTLETLTNEEFFLNYTREEYLHFASRTDIVEQEPSPSGSEATDDANDTEEVGDEIDNADDEACGSEDADEATDDQGEEEEEDEDYEWEESEELDKHGLLNIILGGVIEKFREDNGRGPNTEEVLDLRRAVAAELDLEIPELPNQPDGDQLPEGESSATARKRPNVGGDDGRQSKRVKFAKHLNG